MSKHSLLERLLYKKEYVGKIEKGGEIFVKYRRVKRFDLSRIKQIGIVVAILLLGLLVIYLSSFLIVPRARG